MTSTITPINSQASDSTSANWVGERADEWDSRSVTKHYHRMKASEAPEYIERLRNSHSKVKLEKLEEDERRIVECRARVFKNPGTSELQQELETSFRDWWNEVKGHSGDERIPYSWDGRKDRVKPIICTKSRGGAREVGVDDDPAHDVNAYFMFFEKKGHEWKGKDYRGQRFPKYEKFPGQRITVHEALYDDTYNPFKPIHDENGKPYLRYIHIPANHMGVSKDTITSVRSIYTDILLPDIVDRGMSGAEKVF